MIESIQAKKGTTKRVVVVFYNTFGGPKTGVSVTVRVVLASDNLYLQSDGSWGASPQADPTAVEWSSANSPGIYYFDFQLPDAVNSYLITFDGGNSVQTRFVYAWLDAVSADETDLHRVKAVLANRQQQEIASGIVTVMDDDGLTPLLTLTPGVDNVDNPTTNVLTVSDA